MTPLIKRTKKSTTSTEAMKKRKMFFIEKVARFCDKCGRPYSIDDVELLQQNEYSTIIHFACRNCKARHFATFIRPLGITSRLPVNTDLSVDEIADFAVRDSISANDVLDVHEALQEAKVTVGDLIKG